METEATTNERSELTLTDSDINKMTAVQLKGELKKRNVEVNLKYLTLCTMSAAVIVSTFLIFCFSVQFAEKILKADLIKLLKHSNSDNNNDVINPSNTESGRGQKRKHVDSICGTQPAKKGKANAKDSDVHMHDINNNDDNNASKMQSNKNNTLQKKNNKQARTEEDETKRNLVENLGTKLGNLIFYLKNLIDNDSSAKIIMFSQVLLFVAVLAS